MFSPNKKVEIARAEVIGECGCRIGCAKCNSKLQIIAHMAQANIPVLYWNLKMSDFTGPQIIKDATQKYIADLSKNYSNGTSVCFAGTLGTGKTYSICNILKSALVQKFSAYYTSLGEMANYFSNIETRFKFNDLLFGVDFLAIDEIDSRHIAASDAAQDFFGACFERIIRFRIQNKLPILMATNNASLEEAFSGQFRRVVESLGNLNTIIVPSIGKDFRLNKGASNA